MYSKTFLPGVEPVRSPVDPPRARSQAIQTMKLGGGGGFGSFPGWKSDSLVKKDK